MRSVGPKGRLAVAASLSVLYAAGPAPADAQMLGTASANPYLAYPVDRDRLWVLNAQTGAVSLCVAPDAPDKAPVCSPDSGDARGKTTQYRYDPITNRMIPLTDGARPETREAPPPLPRAYIGR